MPYADAEKATPMPLRPACRYALLFRFTLMLDIAAASATLSHIAGRFLMPRYAAAAAF